MLPTLHYPVSIELAPLVQRTSNAPSHFITHPADQYHLRVRYEKEGPWRSYFYVHVPVQLKPFIEGNQVVSLHLESVKPNSAMGCLFEVQPDFIMFGVRTKDGREVHAVPRRLLRSRQVRLLFSIAGLAVGAAALAAGWYWVAAAGLMTGTHWLRTRATIAHKVFKTVRTVDAE